MVFAAIVERELDGLGHHGQGLILGVAFRHHLRQSGNNDREPALGLRFENQRWPSTLTQDECKARLVAMNDDPDVLGVILQPPVPEHIHGRSLASAIHPFKDL